MFPTVLSEPVLLLLLLLKFSFKHTNVFFLVVGRSVVMHCSREAGVVSVRSFVIEALMICFLHKDRVCYCKNRCMCLYFAYIAYSLY